VPAAAVETPAYAVTETATKTRTHKAGASEPRMEETRVTRAKASEVWTEKAATEPAVLASAKSDGNSDRPSPAPWVTPTPAPLGYPNPSPMHNTGHTRSNTLENNKDSLVSERGCLPIS
jgi:hypothetical protein